MTNKNKAKKIIRIVLLCLLFYNVFLMQSCFVLFPGGEDWGRYVRNSLSELQMTRENSDFITAT